jgi:outer membrane lipoprotein LolB
MVQALPSRRLVAALWFAAVLLLSSCRTLPPTVSQPWPVRRAALQAITQFTFTGRLAATSGNQGFSAGLQWQQQNEAAVLRLRGPLGLGAMQIDYDAETLSVVNSDGVRVAGDAAGALVRDTLGFDPPLASLRYWLLGCSDPASSAEEMLDDMQRLQSLRQQGWQIDYQSYQRVLQGWRPQRLSVQRDDRKLKLVIENWRVQ